MTSEQKARAWEWAAVELIGDAPHDGDYSHCLPHIRHAFEVVVPRLRRQAARIRNSTKAKRERREREL